jgi:RNA polymerase sigma-70 factor (ECF subfamily)
MNMPTGRPGNVTDDALTAALATRLDAGFEQVVLAYQHRLFAFALRISGSPQDAEEIAQDAFVRAYRALQTYEAARVCALALRPWLFSIALNIYRNRVRRHQPAQTPLDDDDDDTPHLQIVGDAHDWPEVAAEAAEQRRELAMVIAGLPPRYRIAVVLRHVEGVGYCEIAETLGQPVGTVKANVHRGTRLLREALVTRRRLEEVAG